MKECTCRSVFHLSSAMVRNTIFESSVEDKVIIELKSVKDLHPAHEAQLVNYLKATGIEVGLLINFGDSVQVKRKILDIPRSSASKP